MLIGSYIQHYSSYADGIGGQNGNKLPPTNGEGIKERQNLTVEVEPRHYDFTSMSSSEFGALVHSGEIDLDGLQPVMLDFDLSESDFTLDSGREYNYIEYAKSQIEFRRNTGLPTDYHQKLLNETIGLQGNSRQPKIN